MTCELPLPTGNLEDQTKNHKEKYYQEDYIFEEDWIIS